MKSWKSAKEKEIAKREKALQKHQARLKKITDRIANSDEFRMRDVERAIKETTFCAVKYAELVDLGAKDINNFEEDVFGSTLEE